MLKLLRFLVRHSGIGLAWLLGVATGILVAAPLLDFRLPGDLAAMAGAILGAAITVFGAWSFAHTREAANLESLRHGAVRELLSVIGALEHSESEEGRMLVAPPSSGESTSDEATSAYVDALIGVEEWAASAHEALEGVTRVYQESGAEVAMLHRKALIALLQIGRDVEEIRGFQWYIRPHFLSKTQLARARLAQSHEELDKVVAGFKRLP